MVSTHLKNSWTSLSLQSNSTISLNGIWTIQWPLQKILQRYIRRSWVSVVNSSEFFYDSIRAQFKSSETGLPLHILSENKFTRSKSPSSLLVIPQKVQEEMMNSSNHFYLVSLLVLALLVTFPYSLPCSTTSPMEKLSEQKRRRIKK